MWLQSLSGDYANSSSPCPSQVCFSLFFCLVSNSANDPVWSIWSGECLHESCKQSGLRSACNWWVSYLVKQLLACGAGLDGKLQLGVHRGDANIDLRRGEKKETGVQMLTRSNSEVLMYQYVVKHRQWRVCVCVWGRESVCVCVGRGLYLQSKHTGLCVYLCFLREQARLIEGSTAANLMFLFKTLNWMLWLYHRNIQVWQ